MAEMILPAGPRLAAIKNFALCYGSCEVDAFEGFDLVILEPAAYSADEIKRIRRHGALVCGYLSALEISGSLDELRVAPEDYLVIKGQRAVNRAYGNWIMDPRSERWNHLVLEMADTVLARGYDGLFLDTIGDVEDPFLPRGLAAQLIPAAARLVKRVREAFPAAVLIQNGGINDLYRFTAPYIDGLCWENFPLSWPPPGDWVAHKLNQLEDLCRRYGLRLLLLAEVDPPLSAGATSPEVQALKKLQAALNQRGFLFYAAPRGYTAGVNTFFAKGS